jgi:hypothetical protein
MNDDNKNNLEFIHKYADESVKFCYERINSLNTLLAVIIGFDANFAAVLSRMPTKNIFQFHRFATKENHSNYSFQLLQLFDGVIYFINALILIIRPLIGFFLLASLVLAIMGLSPKHSPSIFPPQKMLEQSKKDRFMEKWIENREKVLIECQKVANKKADMLKLALLFLALSSMFIIIFNSFDTSTT